MERANEMQPHLIKFVEAVGNDAPDSEYFVTVKDYVSDPLLSAKLGFLISVSTEMDKFLRDDPLLPFMYDDLLELMRSLISRVDILTSRNAGEKLAKIDLSKNDNLIPSGSIELRFSADAAIKKNRKSLKDPDILTFRNQCRKFLVTLITKLLFKSPIKYPFVCAVSCLSPFVMRRENSENFSFRSSKSP
ncbi:hypothetical protein QAD02_001947 [Eretmocerus hayati]|uniref:Uncharacterized protein n=1 Tax=Eretmocerus hayati TaxID=131215 RepID=A0ACC2NHN5_9HYME|nr:hypothetical protein QAD02_001947 [Eretmocerus hayati]